mgnify:FL=1|jgi:hypothetical protein
MSVRTQLAAMLRSLAEVSDDGSVFTMGDAWDVTAHAGRPGSGLSIQQVVKVKLDEGFVVVETAKGHRYVVVDTDLHAFAQEPAKGDRAGRKAGFV